MGCSQSVPVVESSSTPSGNNNNGSKREGSSPSGASSSPRGNYAEHVMTDNSSRSGGKGNKKGAGGGGGTSGGYSSGSDTNNRGRFASYASGASTPEESSQDDGKESKNYASGNKNNKNKNSDDGDDNRSLGSDFSHDSSRGSSKGNTLNKKNGGGLPLAPNSAPNSRRGSANNATGATPVNAALLPNKPAIMVRSTSAVGLDELIEERREVGDLRQNVVHIEVPFGKPIEEVYDGVHSGPVLGSGISGLVRLVTHKATGLKYAVKVLDLGLVDTTEGLRQLREEIFIMCQLDHPNIVRLEEVYESHSEIYLVQELCLGGELFDRLDEQPDYHYTERECARLIKQMLSAVRYLHSKGIIHRDLKLENFLFSSTAADSELKMIDFGLSKHFRYGEVQHEAVGTPYTVAPEVIRGSYDERCDLWAIGVISFLLLSGEPPFGGCGGPEPLMTVRSNILKGHFRFEPEEIWNRVSVSAREFITKMLVTDPKLRPTAREAQKHEWLQKWASRNRLNGDGTVDQDNVLNPNVIKALVNFKEFSDMRKLLCEVLSFTLLPYQIKELRVEFEKMDTDGSGEISLSALKQVLVTNAGAGSLGALTEEEVEDIFNAMRVRKTETRIHWHEFIAAGLSQCQVDDRNLRLAFDRLDSDHKGYITLDDIMDMMGSDATQSDATQREEAISSMWGDTIRAVKCQHARITYDDFLLLMKGQTKDTPSHELERDLESSVTTLKPSSAGQRQQLPVVPELTDMESSVMEEGVVSPQSQEEENLVTLASGDMVAVGEGGMILEPSTPPTVHATLNGDEVMTAHLTPTTTMPLRPTSPYVPSVSQSAPSTPADHKLILDVDDTETPPFLNECMDIVSSGPGVPGTSASLTPPQSPVRSARDFVTPLYDDRFTVDLPSDVDSILVPGLPPRPVPYTRRRSRSVGGVDDQEDGNNEAKDKDLHVLADAVRDMIVPESCHFHFNGIDSVVKDEKKTALQVNRHLYRAHRQMRLAVLEASKRFEEEQTSHATKVLTAQQETDEGKTDHSGGMIHAGLVMRHGLKSQVSSEAINELLRENEMQQQALVEKANRRGGRGRRSRKKTISDMSGMLSSMGADEMGVIAASAVVDQTDEEAAVPIPLGDRRATMAGRIASQTKKLKRTTEEDGGSEDETNLPSPVITDDEAADDSELGLLRAATVPGEFRPTNDPFSKQGKYGAVATYLGIAPS